MMDEYFIAAEISDGHAYLSTAAGEIWHVWVETDGPRIEKLTEQQILDTVINMTKHQRRFARDAVDD
jgi:hypothetical protein